MTYLLVQVDGVAIAGVETDDIEIVGVHVEGSTFTESYAVLSVSGGNYSQDIGVDRRRWVGGLELQIGQTVDVTLLQHGLPIGTVERSNRLKQGTSDTPGTHYICSDADADADADAEDDDEPLPRLKKGYTLRLSGDSLETAMLTTVASEQGFTLDISWIYARPDSASVLFGSYVIENVDQHGRGRILVENRIAVGSGVRLELIA